MSIGLPILPVAIGGAVAAALLAASAAVMLRQHDDLVTWRLKDKDWQAIEVGLRRDIRDRNDKINAVAGREYGDAGLSAAACATDISSSFERGVAFGRVISHAKSSTPAAAGGLPGSRGVRDYSESWAAGAYRPGSQSAASSDLRAADR